MLSSACPGLFLWSIGLILFCLFAIKYTMYCDMLTLILDVIF
uniref:Iron hydrogenase family protein n=1 Tax=Rhizophora mucronata TaxID=61149 RepID=A0A2P2L5Y4_RHIMU